MKKKAFRVLCCALALLCMVGCRATSKVTLGNYKGFTYTPADTTVTQEELDDYIDDVIQKNAQRVADESRDGTKVQQGDELWVDYVGYMDGEAFSGGSTDGNGTMLTIGSGSMIDGFEDALVGATVGEEVTIDVTFPDPYKVNPDYSGKDAQFDVTIHYVCDYVLPEYTDEFVSSYTDGAYTNRADYEVYVMQQMQEDKQTQATNEAVNEIRTQALAQCTFDLKDAELEEFYNQFISYYTQMAKFYGFDTLEAYLSAAGTDADEFKQTALSYAQDALCQKLFYAAVAKAEDMSVTDEEFEARIDAYLAQYGYTGNREGFEEAYDMDLIRESMLCDMVNEKLIEWSEPLEG